MTDTFLYPQPFWRVVETERFPTFNTLSQNIRNLAEQRVIQLPNLRNCQNLCIGSDYSGEQNYSEYQVLGFVIANRDTAHIWSANMQTMRKEHHLGNKVIAYKSLNNSAGYRILSRFFEAADTLEGICVIIAIHKSCQFFDLTPLQGSWTSQPVFIKALRLAHLVSFFLSGLTKPNQNILWVTDRDNIVANDEQGRDFVQMVDIVKDNYMPHLIGMLELATTASNDPTTMELEDLTSIPDIIAGAFSHLYTEQYQTEPETFFKPKGRIVDTTRKKIKRILQWVANNETPLKKLILVITPNPATNENNIQLMKYRIERNSLKVHLL